MLVAVTQLHEDANNPRTEFPEAALEELAADIQQRGIFQPLVVHPAVGDGRHLIHFGAKRLCAAIRAGLSEVPIVLRELPVDCYAQVAENQKRHGLTPLEMAKFIRERIACGDSNATTAKQLGMNLTTVAHHLSLLELPPALDDALQSGRCISLHSALLCADRNFSVMAVTKETGDVLRRQFGAFHVDEMAGVGREVELQLAEVLVQAIGPARLQHRVVGAP